jgi:hypothetical protein
MDVIFIVLSLTIFVLFAFIGSYYWRCLSGFSPFCGHVSICVLRRSFPGVTSFALRTRKEKYDEASVYVFIYGYIYMKSSGLGVC